MDISLVFSKICAPNLGDYYNESKRCCIPSFIKIECRYPIDTMVTLGVLVSLAIVVIVGGYVEIT